MLFLQRKKCISTGHCNDGKMDVNISPWLIISNVTLGKPWLSEWFICQHLEFFTPIMGYLAHVAMGSEDKLRAWSKMKKRFQCFLGVLFISDFWSKVFISNEVRIKGGKNQWVSCLFVLMFFTYPLFLLPNSKTECSALRGEAAGEGFFLWFLWCTGNLLWHY